MLLMHLAMCERCFGHGGNCVSKIFRAFYMIKLLLMVFNQFIHGAHYSCVFLNTNDQ
jgi:hypothetical protein